MISPDSGPVHIARALNTPTISLFSEENPERWGYKNKKFDFIKKNYMKEITVNELLRVIEELNVL